MDSGFVWHKPSVKLWIEVDVTRAALLNRYVGEENFPAGYAHDLLRETDENLYDHKRGLSRHELELLTHCQAGDKW